MFESDDRSGHPAGGESTPPTSGDASPDLTGLEAMAPGPELAALLGRVDVTTVGDAYDLVEIAAACERLKAWTNAIEVEAAAQLSMHPVCHAPEAARHGFNAVRAAGQLLAPRLGQSPTTATNRVATAVQLVDELDDTLTALARGQIDYQKAAALAVGVRALDPPDGGADRLTGEVITPDGIRRGLVARVQARVLPKAGVRSLRQHRDAIDRAVASVAPTTAEQRHQAACEQRRVEFRSEADGMAWLHIYAPAVDLTAVKVMLDAAAHAAKTGNPDDPRTLDQLRVDTLTALAWTILENGHLPDADDDGNTADCGHDRDRPAGADTGPGADTKGTGNDDGVAGPGHSDSAASPGHSDSADPSGCGCGCGGGRPNREQRRRGLRLARRNGRAAAVHVTVPISTLLGADDRPGELDGYGPITADTARRVAAHGSWRRLLTDPASGVLLDYGTSRYHPPPDLVEHVHNRDRTCRFPTCSRPARVCQFDHTIPAGSPGWSTSAGNGGPLSAGCHNAKTHAGWRLDQPQPGRFVWTAPTGHSYQVDPEIIGPIIQSNAGREPSIDDLEPEWSVQPPDPDPPPF
jgi:Domain of unknown function (DUF222)